MILAKIITLSLLNKLIAFVLVVFILTIVIKFWNDRKKKKLDSELSSKVDSYLQQHNFNALAENEEDENLKIVGHPKLHILKIVGSNDRVSIYFSNNGSNIYDIKITSLDTSDISIAPQKNLCHKSTGCIKFSNASNNNVTFTLNYSDESMNKASKKYLVKISDKKIEEIY